MDEQQRNDDQPNEGVRLVGRREAEAAIQAGQAISATSIKSSAARKIEEAQSDDPVIVTSSIKPVISGETLQRALDLRDEVNLQDETPDEQLSFPEDEDELPETDTGSLRPWTERPEDEPFTPAIGAIEDTPEEISGGWSLSALSEASRLGADASGLGDKDFDFESMHDDPFADDQFQFKSSLSESPSFDNPPSGEVPKVEAPKAPTPGEVAMERVELLKSSSLTQRVGTGAIFAVLAAICFAEGTKWVLTLLMAIVLLAAVEYFDALRRVGFRPPTALGLLSVAGAILGVYARGDGAIPLVLAMATAFIFLWFLTGIIEESPTSNASVTLLGIVWIGIFGSFGALMLREPARHGIAFILGAVLCVIAYDTAAYVGGTLVGKHLMAPRVSPGKTWEGLACATIASLVVGGLIVQAIHPWSFKGGIVLGLVVAIVAPIGDLAESMVKRDLGLKDMGRILPGHGGILDRFDAMLFVLPATYYLVRMLNLA